MTRSKLEFEEPKDLEQSICSDLTKEYGLDYEFGSSVRFGYNQRNTYKGVIIGFNPNTQKYKIICKNDDNSTPLQGKKNRIIEIEKDDIITFGPMYLINQEIAEKEVKLIDNGKINEIEIIL